MSAVSYVLLAFVGALIGADLVGAHSWLFAAAVGASVGVGIAQAVSVGRRLSSLQEEIDRLRTSIATITYPAAAVRPDATRRDSDVIDDGGISAPAARTAAPVPIVARPATSPPALASQRTPAPSPAPAPTSAPASAPASAAARAPAPELPIVRLVRQFFTGGNALVRAGVVVLFFGVAFLLRYLAEHTHVPIQLRLTGVAVGALVLLLLGWRLRSRRPGYALALQGGAVGILYLTTFAALRLYALLTPAAAFPLLVLMAAISATLAVLQNSQAFALLAVTGGFLAPILASSGQGSHVVLFSYYAVLNAVILGSAWFRAWRALNVAGFLFTFVIATIWGVLHYRPEDFSSTEPFLVLFFLFYIAIAVLFTLRQPLELRGYVDATLVFGMPIAAFSLQAAMLRAQLLALAYSAVSASAIYLAIAWLVRRRRSPAQQLLVECFLALGITFLTLAIPLALDGTWNAATWALEGAALIWIGCRQDRPLARAFGAALQLAAGCTIWWRLDLAAGDLALPEGMYLSGLLLGAATSFAARTLSSNRQQLRDYESPMLGALFLWGVIWWSVSGFSELQRRIPHGYQLAAGLSFVTLTALLSSELCRRSALAIARIPALLLLPLMLVFALADALKWQHPAANGGWFSWPLAFAVFALVTARHEGAPHETLARLLHALGAWLLAALASWELAWLVSHVAALGDSWSAVAWAVIPALLLSWIPALSAQMAWPFMRHRDTYLLVAGNGFAAYLAIWTVCIDVLMRGDSYPLPYLPLLNPLDLAQGAVLLVVIRHFVILRRDAPASVASYHGTIVGALALLVFLALNGALVRALNHLAGVPFTLQVLLHSTLVQTSLSIYWALLALTTMLIATRRASRVVWIAGATLLAIVVVKLFLVDLSSIGTIERIVSFVSVGVLMLVLGYFSPLPPVAEVRR